MISGVTRTAGVIGAPVTHSLSPLLMNSWIAAAGLDAVYVALPARAEFDTDGFRALGRSGLVGVNVTLPFKARALQAADQVSDAARLAGAANLLCFGPDGIRADNTDMDGAREALTSAGCEFRDRTVLVLGAGGVAQAICAAALRDRAHPDRQPHGRPRNSAGGEVRQCPPGRLGGATSGPGRGRHHRQCDKPWP